MKHSQTITPIRTNRNKFNSNQPFRVVFSGTFNQNVYYDLSSAYLKMKVRCKPNTMKTITKSEGDTADSVADYTGNFYVPTTTPSPVDYIQGFFSIFDDTGAELKFELNNVNNEEQCNHCATIEMIDKFPIEFEQNRHIRRLYNGHKGFDLQDNSNFNLYNLDNDAFSQFKTFDNKYRFVKHDDGYWYTTMYIPFTQILEPATRTSLLRIYAAEFDLIFKDTEKFFNTNRPHIIITQGKGATDNSCVGEPYVTIESTITTGIGQTSGTIEGFDSFNCEEPSNYDKILFEHDMSSNFFKEKPEIVDCDLYMDQYTIESTEEAAKFDEQNLGSVFRPVCYQLDNHVFDINPDSPVNKFKIECPFKPLACYYYFTHDVKNELSLRTDYLYLNPPKHAVIKTLTGQSTPYPHYENDPDVRIVDPLSYFATRNLPTKFATPDERHYSELIYNLKKFDHPLIDYHRWKQIHRLYSIDMTSDLNMGDDKNTLFFEIGLEDTVPDNVRLHVIFTRDYKVV